MLTETYKGYRLEALPVLTVDHRFGVAVSIRMHDTRRVYQENTSIGFILQIEAEKESIQFGKRLVDEILFRAQNQDAPPTETEPGSGH